MVLCVFKLLVLFAAAGFTTISMAENEPLWLGEPAISPDGTKIAFRFEGQIWIVASAGGDATPLTPAGFHGTSSIWSPDGATIAFAAEPAIQPFPVRRPLKIAPWRQRARADRGQHGQAGL